MISYKYRRPAIRRGPVRGMRTPMYRPVRPVYRRDVVVQSAPSSRVYSASKTSNRQWAPFGKSKTVKHRYSATLPLNAPVGGCVDHLFLANGLYDPDVTGTGHQPYAYDQMTALYNQWVVISSKITLTCYNNQSGLLPFWLCVALRDENTSLTGTTVEVLRETPGLVQKLLSPGSGAAIGMVDHAYDARKFFNCKDPTDVTNLEGFITTDPDEKAYYHVIICPQNGTDDLAVNVVNVDIEYTVVWTGPKIVGQS